MRSRPIFFNMGSTKAFFQLSANSPFWRDRLTIDVNTGSRTSRHCMTRCVGKGSSAHVLLAEAKIISRTSDSDSTVTKGKAPSVRGNSLGCLRYHKDLRTSMLSNLLMTITQ